MNRILILRSSTAGARPVGRDTGELYVNLPDNQLGVIDDTNAPVDLIAVRHFSAAASYFTGDCVLYNGKIYIATGIFGPGPFNPLDWTVVTMATDLALYMPLSGGTFTGIVRFPANNSVVINGAAGSARALIAQTAGVNRWQVQFADYTAESGVNAGSNFVLTPCSDVGNLMPPALTISRATGVADFGAAPTVLGVPIGGGAGGATVSDTAPLNPSEGDLWWDSVGAQMYVWYVDATSSQWVPVISNTGPIGPPGPTAISTDAGNQARLGTDQLTYVPLGAGSNFNRIINGDMSIDQRNNGAVVTGTNVTGMVADRWRNVRNGGRAANCQRITVPSNTDPLVLASNLYYYLAFASNSNLALGAAEANAWQHAIEASMLADVRFGNGATPVTLSFWARSNLTGLFGGSLGGGTVSRVCPFTYSLPPPAQTWTKVAVTIPGDPSGFNHLFVGTGVGLWVYFDLGCGATTRGPPFVWTATGQIVGANGAVSPAVGVGNFLHLTGVKLEVGDVATPFEQQSAAKNLADCQRYFERIDGCLINGVTSNSTTYMSIGCVPKRIVPTATPVSPVYTGTGAGLAFVSAPTPGNSIINASFTTGVTATSRVTFGVNLDAELS
jgi:hypothetical protein